MLSQFTNLKYDLTHLVTDTKLISNHQGMTLERVIVDLSRAFEPSQIYVARESVPLSVNRLPANKAHIVSRARSLKGLKVMGLPRVNLGGANEQVKEFFDKYLRNTSAEAALPPSQS
jgi:hypothetical protein